MNIYIDESGSFTSDMKKEHSISCVAALMIPDILEDSLFKQFEQWKLTMPDEKKDKNKNDEIKGSKLNEDEMGSFLAVLTRFDVIVEIVCIDMGGVSNTDVKKYQNELSKSFSSSATGIKINIDLKKDILKSFPEKLFVQSYCTYMLIDRTLNVLIPYYVQRLPSELGSFKWFFDSKDIVITEYEKAIEILIKPFVQWNNHYDNKSGVLEGEDYSAFEKYLVSHNDLLEPLKSSITKNHLVFSINEIMEKMIFTESHKKSGLEIVDIIANCARRAIIGNLQFPGWNFFSNLVVFRKDCPIKLLTFSAEKECKMQASINFISYLLSHAKQMIVPSNLKSKIKMSNMGYSRWTYRENLRDRKRITIECY